MVMVVITDVGDNPITYILTSSTTYPSSLLSQVVGSRSAISQSQQLTKILKLQKSISGM